MSQWVLKFQADHKSKSKNKTIKVVNENVRGYFHNLGTGKDFLTKTWNPEASSDHLKKENWTNTMEDNIINV